MITLLGYSAPVWAWILAAAAAAALVYLGRRVAAVHHFSGRPQDGFLWCDDCEQYCSDDYPCPCCAADDGQAGELEPIGEYDDGEPVTGELRAIQSDGRLQWGPASADEAWWLELAEINRAQRAGELDELERVATPIFAALSNDPDVIAWDLRQQAARAWEITHVEFPKLRAELARDYAAAAAPKPWPPTSWEMAA